MIGRRKNKRRGAPRYAVLWRAGVFLWLATWLAACDGRANDKLPWLDTLDAGDGVKASGKRLMALPFGLHRIDRGARLDRGAGSTMLIGIHGGNSEGYEWVYPLQTLGGDNVQVHFYRWDWTTCPDRAAEGLQNLVAAHVVTDPPSAITIVGHSYGGVVLGHLAARWQAAVPLEAHTVAAPLVGLGDTKCPALDLSGGVSGAASLHQWRTQKSLDGAFRNLEFDPQAADVPRAGVTLLPDTYRGHRLGHNWSISYVADALTARASLDSRP